MDIIEIPTRLIFNNDGRIPSVPSNPRTFSRQNLDRLKENIVKYPEMLQMRGLLVYPLGSIYVAIGGNMRLKALQELGIETAPCIVIPQETTKKQLRAYALLDNGSTGEWDFDKLRDAWSGMSLENFGLTIGSSFSGQSFTETETATMDPTATEYRHEQEQESKQSAWHKSEDYTEPLCDLRPCMAIHKRGDFWFASSFRRTAEGYPLTEIKTEQNVNLFVQNAVEIAASLIGRREDWCIVSAPKRRHLDWNFGEAVCLSMGKELGIKVYTDVIKSKNRDRIKPIFTLTEQIREPNIILYDDIITTSKTMATMRDLFVGKNRVSITGICN